MLARLWRIGRIDFFGIASDNILFSKAGQHPASLCALPAHVLLDTEWRNNVRSQILTTYRIQFKRIFVKSLDLTPFCPLFYKNDTIRIA